MTEKRFTLAYETNRQNMIWWVVRDGDITLWKEETVATLNELYEENEQLKEIITGQRDAIKKDNEWENKAIEEIKQLKQQVAFLEEFIKTGVQYEYYQKIYDENEQLKSRISDYDIALKRLQDLADNEIKKNEQLKSEIINVIDKKIKNNDKNPSQDFQVYSKVNRALKDVREGLRDTIEDF